MVKVFVPARVASTIVLPAESGVSFGPEEIIQTQDGFSVRGCAALGDTETIRQVLLHAGLKAYGKALVDYGVYVVFSRETTVADVDITHEEKTASAGTTATRSFETCPAIIKDTVEVLAMFAMQTGWKCTMHFRNTQICNPFIDDDEDRIHFIVGASPPGSVGTIARHYACGVLLDPRGYSASSNGPTPGRGRVFKDEGDVEIGQIVGRNIFLFTPALTEKNVTIFVPEGGRLLCKLVQQCSRVLAEGAPEVPEIVVDSVDAFRRHLTSYLIANLDHLKERIRCAEEDTASALKKYHEGLASQKDYRLMIRVFQEQVKDRIGEIVGDDWKRLSAHPLIERVSICDEGLHVRTFKLMPEEGGRRYDYPSYVIRIRFGGILSVWTEAPTHPRGIAHPHISEYSSFCFGNAGPAIAQAIEDLRFADAIELVIEWLVHGYDATLAAHKIEEWPLLEVQQHTPQQEAAE